MDGPWPADAIFAVLEQHRFDAGVPRQDTDQFRAAVPSISDDTHP